MQAATTQFDYLFSVARTCYNDWWVGSSNSVDTSPSRLLNLGLKLKKNKNNYSPDLSCAKHFILLAILCAYYKYTVYFHTVSGLYVH